MEWLKCKILSVPSVGKNVEQQNSYISGSSVKWYNHYKKTVRILQGQTLWLSNSIPRYLHKINKYIVHKSLSQQCMYIEALLIIAQN